MCLTHLSLMSVKKSWDVERKPAKVAEPKTVAQAPSRTKRRAATSFGFGGSRKKEVVHKRDTRPRQRVQIAKEPLKLRRARERRVFYIGLAVFGALLAGCLFYAAWMPSLRIEEVRVEGSHSEGISELARAELTGTHLFIVPRNSLFFIPESDIRKRILKEYPSVVAVSFKSNGLRGLTVVPVMRSSAFLWCGVTHEVHDATCYGTDAEGFVFAPYDGVEPVASSTLLLKVYGPLVDDAVVPIRAHVGYASALPHSLRLAKTFRALGANITELAFRNDEADFYTSGGTRITYVIGREKEAAQLAASVFPDIQLNDGSVEYVDLRFESKVYLRKQAQAVVE